MSSTLHNSPEGLVKGGPTGDQNPLHRTNMLNGLSPKSVSISPADIRVAYRDDQGAMVRNFRFAMSASNFKELDCQEVSDKLTTIDQVVKEILERNPDVVVLDGEMGAISGTKVAELLREKNFTGGIVGHSGAMHLEEEFIPYGPKGQRADFFLAKPAGASDIQEIIIKAYEAALQRRSLKS